MAGSRFPAANAELDARGFIENVPDNVSLGFEWVVMAIRIQRQGGGNIAQLLDAGQR